MVTLNELKDPKISHNSFEVFVSLLESRLLSKFASQFGYTLKGNELRYGFLPELAIVSIGLEKNKARYAEMDFLATIEESRISELLANVNDLAPQMVSNQSIDDLLNKAREIITSSKSDSSVTANEVNRLIRASTETLDLKKSGAARLATDTLLTFPLIIALALLTYPHEMFTRYPDGKLLTQKDFDQKLGIVTSAQKIWESLDIIFPKIESWMRMESNRS